jgi:hypothetical protein
VVEVSAGGLGGAGVRLCSGSIHSGLVALGWTALQAAEKVDLGTSAAKAVLEIKALNAALEALLHPNAAPTKTKYKVVFFLILWNSCPSQPSLIEADFFRGRLRRLSLHGAGLSRKLNLL